MFYGQCAGDALSVGTKRSTTMDDFHRCYTNSNPNREVDEAKSRCRAVSDRIRSLPLSKITDSCKRTLLRLVNSELRFLTRLSSTSPDFSGPISVNVGYLESVTYILQHPSISGISCVCKRIPLSSENGVKKDSLPNDVHVDIVCTFDRLPVWFIVSDRNPKYISWSGSHKNKGLKVRIEQVLVAARTSLTLKPALVILFFASGLDKVVTQKLVDEFGASEFQQFSLPDFDSYEELEGEWCNVLMRSYEGASVFQIKVNFFGNILSRLESGVKDPILEVAKLDLFKNQAQMISDDAFHSLISRMKPRSLDVESGEPDDLLGEDLLHFDTTALIALVSGISNGGTGKLLAAPECEMRKRYKSNYEFVIAQASSELQNPILVGLGGLISGKRGIICETVYSEFKELVSMCGGPNEKFRADQLVKCLLVVPDNPSARMMSLTTTRKIAMKNKVIFGTADYWRAPTLTANMGFVRAISQTGMSLLTLEHKPRALTGD